MGEDNPLQNGNTSFRSNKKLIEYQLAMLQVDRDKLKEEVKTLEDEIDDVKKDAAVHQKEYDDLKIAYDKTVETVKEQGEKHSALVKDVEILKVKAAAIGAAVSTAVAAAMKYFGLG
jgi:chromosome segregation ATPase